MVLTSLPHPGRHDFRGSTQYRLLNVSRQDFGEEKALWLPQMMVLEPRACDRSMQVSFTPPPEAFGFKLFRIDLYGDGHYTGHHQVEGVGEEMLSVTFEEINMSYDKLYVILVPEHHDECGQGQCKRSRSHSVKWTDEDCHLPYFPVEDDQPPPPPVSSDPISTAGIIGIVVAAVVIPSLAVLGAYCYRKVTRNQSVLVVYDGSNGNSPHTCAVDALCRLIKTCKLGNVEKYDMFQSTYPGKIPCDVALFINSDDIDRNFARFRESPPAFEYLKNFVRRPSNVHCVRFMYSQNSNIPHISSDDRKFTSSAFCLPDDITLLLTWLNKNKDLKTDDVLHGQEMHDMKAAIEEIRNSQPITIANESGYYTSQNYEQPQFDESIVEPPIDDNLDNLDNPDDNLDSNTLIDCQNSNVFHGFRSVSEIGSDIGEEVARFNRENPSLQREESVRSSRTLALHDV